MLKDITTWTKALWGPKDILGYKEFPKPKLLGTAVLI